MVAKQLRTVFHQTLPRLRAVLAGGATSQIAAVFEVWAVARRYEHEGQSPDEGTDSCARLPFRDTGDGRPGPVTPAEARAEVRDRETYYAELRFAVHSQSRSVPAARAAVDDPDADPRERRPDHESWDGMTARFGDTWT